MIECVGLVENRRLKRESCSSVPASRSVGAVNKNTASAVARTAPARHPSAQQADARQRMRGRQQPPHERARCVRPVRVLAVEHMQRCGRRGTQGTSGELQCLGKRFNTCSLVCDRSACWTGALTGARQVRFGATVEHVTRDHTCTTHSAPAVPNVDTLAPAAVLPGHFARPHEQSRNCSRTTHWQSWHWVGGARAAALGRQARCSGARQSRCLPRLPSRLRLPAAPALLRRHRFLPAESAGALPSAA